MSKYDVVENAIKEINKCVEKYDSTYLDVVPYIGHHYVIEEVIASSDVPVVYFVNNSDSEETIKELKEYFKSLKQLGFKYAQGLKTIKKGSITFIGATELDIEQKIKKIDINEPVLLINDCTMTARSMSISKIKHMLQPCRTINLVYNNRLSEKENILINTKRVGYVYVDGKEEGRDKFIDGFIINPSEDLEKFKNEENNLRKTLVLAGLSRYKTLASCYTPKGNIIENKYINANYLIIVKKYIDACYVSKIIEQIDDRIGVKIVDSYSDLINLDLIDTQIVITTDEDYVLKDNDNPYLVITLLDETCRNGTLFNIVKKCYEKDLVCNNESENDYDYKYMYIYDEPNIVKKSLLPIYKYKTPETIINNVRNDIEPIKVICQGLKSVDYPNFLPSESFIKSVQKAVKSILGQTKTFRSLLGKGMDYNKKPQPILVDSVIYSYLNYDLSTGYYIDNDYSKNFNEVTKIFNQVISKHMLAENYRFNSSKENRSMLYNEIYKAIMTPYIEKDYMSRYNTDDKTELFNYFAIMVYNDLQNLNTSNIIKIVGLAIKLYADENKMIAPKRQVYNKEVYLPIIPAITTDKAGNIDISETYRVPVKYSEVEKIKNGAYLYSKKLKPETEKMYMDYLKNQNWVDWWCKNGDSGEVNFSITTIDKKGMPICFYPDWIIKIKGKKNGKNVIIIVDTKAGMTLDDSGSTGAKIKSLQEWCDKQNSANKSTLFYCGILTFEGGFWKISANNIDYIIDMNYSNFVRFEDWLKGKLV